jgi:hypothetical protein
MEITMEIIAGRISRVPNEDKRNDVAWLRPVSKNAF